MWYDKSSLNLVFVFFTNFLNNDNVDVPLYGVSSYSAQDGNRY